MSNDDTKDEVVDASPFPDIGEDATGEAIGRLTSIAHAPDMAPEESNGHTPPEEETPPEEWAPAREAAISAQLKERRKRAKPPANLGDAIITLGVHLRTVSVGRGVKNVTATLLWDMDHPVDELASLMGEHAYAAVFRAGRSNQYLGEGVYIKEAGLTVDAENRVKQGLKVTLPRWNNGADQLTSYVIPLVPADLDIASLLDLGASWRLNIQLDIPGSLSLYQLQQAFDLTKKAPATEGDAEYAAVEP